MTRILILLALLAMVALSPALAQQGVPVERKKFDWNSEQGASASPVKETLEVRQDSSSQLPSSVGLLQKLVQWQRYLREEMAQPLSLKLGHVG